MGKKIGNLSLTLELWPSFENGFFPHIFPTAILSNQHVNSLIIRQIPCSMIAEFFEKFHVRIALRTNERTFKAIAEAFHSINAPRCFDESIRTEHTEGDLIFLAAVVFCCAASLRHGAGREDPKCWAHGPLFRFRREMKNVMAGQKG